MYHKSPFFIQVVKLWLISASSDWHWVIATIIFAYLVINRSQPVLKTLDLLWERHFFQDSLQMKVWFVFRRKKKCSVEMVITERSIQNSSVPSKIPVLVAVFVGPTSAFGTPKARGMGEQAWSEEISQMLVCMNSFPFAAFLLDMTSLASFFPSPSPTLNKRQMTSPNLISLAAGEGSALTAAGQQSWKRHCADPSCSRAQCYRFT